MRPGGWDNYKVITDDYAQVVEELVEDRELSVNNVVKKFDNYQDKIKFASFGKTKIKNVKKNCTEGGKTPLDIIKKQATKIEKEINNIKDLKGGRCGKIFKMGEVIAGPRISQQEAHAIRDTTSGELVVSPEEIKRVSLDHCLDVLKK